MIFSKSFKNKFSFISTTSLAVLSALLSSSAVQAMDHDPERMMLLAHCKKMAARMEQMNAEQGIVSSEPEQNEEMTLTLRPRGQQGDANRTPHASLVELDTARAAELDRKIEALKAKVATARLKRDADQGDVEAQLDLGAAYYNGEVVAQDDEKAFYYLGLAAAQGNSTAFSCLMLNANSKQGHAAAKYYLGKMYSDGHKVGGTTADMSGRYDAAWMSYDHDNALKYFKLAAAQGYAKALEAIILKADKGNPKALYALSELHHKGQGVEQSDGKASYYKALADAYQLRFLDAPQLKEETYRRLSVIYLNGIGVDEDYEKAFYYDTLADAAFNNAEADYYLGQMYENGVGVEKNHQVAAFQYDLAVAKGHIGAQKALKLLTNQGDPSAQYTLGCLYHHANKKDKARKYFELAASQGHEGAQITLRRHFPGG